LKKEAEKKNLYRFYLIPGIVLYFFSINIYRNIEQSELIKDTIANLCVNDKTGIDTQNIPAHPNNVLPELIKEETEPLSCFCCLNKMLAQSGLVELNPIAIGMNNKKKINADLAPITSNNKEKSKTVMKDNIAKFLEEILFNIFTYIIGPITDNKAFIAK
jgi:hypothetical protein